MLQYSLVFLWYLRGIGICTALQNSLSLQWQRHMVCLCWNHIICYPSLDSSYKTWQSNSRIPENNKCFGRTRFPMITVNAKFRATSFYCTHMKHLSKLTSLPFPPIFQFRLLISHSWKYIFPEYVALLYHPASGYIIMSSRQSSR